jgi:hypothetical protein
MMNRMARQRRSIPDKSQSPARRNAAARRPQLQRGNASRADSGDMSGDMMDAVVLAVRVSREDESLVFAATPIGHAACVEERVRVAFDAGPSIGWR